MNMLAIMRPVQGVDVRAEVATHARAELETLWRLYRDGIVREMYLQAKAGAVLILETASLEGARAQLSPLPLIAHGVMSLELLELRPFTALEMLFE